MVLYDRSVSAYILFFPLCLVPNHSSFQVELGASLPPSVAAVVNYRLPNAKIARDATLDAHRFTPQELHALGVVDVLADGGTDGVLREAHKLAEAKAARAKTGVYGLMRTDMLKVVFNAAKLDERRLWPVDAAALARARL
jgi:enoyl-CoA hydratase/carnithine racemase